MIEKRRELPATIDIPWTAKAVAPERLTAMNANHPEQSAAKAGVAGSNPVPATVGGAGILTVQRLFQTRVQSG
jgi:hypothetical protein